MQIKLITHNVNDWSYKLFGEYDHVEVKRYQKFRRSEEYRDSEIFEFPVAEGFQLFTPDVVVLSMTQNELITKGIIDGTVIFGHRSNGTYDSFLTDGDAYIQNDEGKTVDRICRYMDN